MHVLTREERLKLATHNPTLVILFRTIRFEIKFAFLFSLACIVTFRLFPGFFSNGASDTVTYIGKDILEKISYSIVASTVFYFINQHIPKIEKKVSCYHFEVNSVINIVSEIKDLLDRTWDFGNIDPTEGTNPETIYMWLCSVDQNKPPRKVAENEPVFLNWNEFLYYKTKILSGLVNKMIPLHDALERSTLEYLFKVDDLCYRIKNHPGDPVFFERFTHLFTELMYCMVGLNKGLDNKYKHTRAINEYKNKVERLIHPFPHAFDYKMIYMEIQPLTFNNKFLVRLRNVFISVIMGIILFAVFSRNQST